MKQVSFTLNRSPQTCSVDEGTSLLDFLRQEKGLTGAKQSCDRKGQCGACTVIVDKKAVRSCLTRVGKVDGADVITIEGLGTPDNPHLIQEAFVLSGAVQCGFCTPGMIMATKALLDENPDPDTSAVKKALSRNLCRCTGYKKIIDAVKLAAKFQTTPDQVRPATTAGTIGVSLPRPTGLLLATGQALFSADIRREGMLELAVVRSPHWHAKIQSIDTSKAEQIPGVVAVITAKDIRGTNRLRPDQPILCEDTVHVMGDAVAAVVAETKEAALRRYRISDRTLRPTTHGQQPQRCSGRSQSMCPRRKAQSVLRPASDQRRCRKGPGRIRLRCGARFFHAAHSSIAAGAGSLHRVRGTGFI